MTRRRFLLKTAPTGETVCLEGSEAHHLAHVLHATPGFKVELLDGSGKVWEGQVASVEGGIVLLEQLRLIEPATSLLPRLILAQSLCKPEKLEWILQKTTELGIDEIFLLEAGRSVVKVPAERLKNKMERWQKIMVAAAKQCHRSTLPLLHPPANCEDFSDQVQADLKILFSENESRITLKSILREVHYRAIVYGVGPEGGWTAKEEACFKGAGFHSVSLGRTILRAETAAIVGLAILQYELSSQTE